MRDAIGRNIRVLRRRNGMSQEKLAEASGLSRVSISNYESGKALPSSSSLSKLAAALAVPLDAFLRPSAAGCGFRFRSDTSFENDVGTATRLQLWSEDYAQLEKLCARVPYAPENVPCYHLDPNRHLVKDVALTFRRRCGLGDDEPALNLFATIERLGLKCLRRAVRRKGLYGVSACSDEQGAFVFINTDAINIERQIFTLAHELGHLIFHRADFKEEFTDLDKASQDETENIADWFAGNFLVPETAIRSPAESALWSVESVVRLKRHFRVSYMTMLRRMSEVGGSDYGRSIRWFRGAYKKLYARSLTRAYEPAPLLSDDFPENERYEELVRQALQEGAITTSRAAELLQIPLADARARIRQWKKGNGSQRDSARR